MTIPELIKKADIVYSKYIRERDSVNGYVKCFTCGKMYPIGEMQCGHFISRDNMETRYSEDNTHPQCIDCNCFNGGNMEEYTIRMIDKYGRDKVDELRRRGRIAKRWTKEELKELIEEYKKKLDKFI